MKEYQVLIVDDVANARKTIRHILTGFNCVFSEAEDGMEAVRLLEKKPFDVVFLDLRLPDMRGSETITKIRRATDGNVIVLTGSKDLATSSAGAKKGVWILEKSPIRRDQVIHAFEEAIKPHVAVAW